MSRSFIQDLGNNGNESTRLNSFQKEERPGVKRMNQFLTPFNLGDIVLAVRLNNFTRKDPVSVGCL